MKKVYVVGIGPGSYEDMTRRAENAIKDSDIIVGYKVYIDLIAPYFEGKEMRPSGMKKEIDRCREALEMAEGGKTVALVSSGDSGVYGMAGLMHTLAIGTEVEVVTIPGVSAANASAATLGAPLMHDFAVISLSDLMTPFDLILKRVEHAAESDMVICLYNPKSKGRPENIVKAVEKVRLHRDKATPVGVVTKATREGEVVEITSLEYVLDSEINMFSTVIIGNSRTEVLEGKMITPRGYDDKYGL